MTQHDRDEHSPYFVEYAQPQTTWLEFFWALVRAVLLALAVALVILALPGCDDYERELAVAEYRERFMESCMPRKGDRTEVDWIKGELICRRITPTGRYGRSFPHIEVRVATVETP